MDFEKAIVRIRRTLAPHCVWGSAGFETNHVSIPHLRLTRLAAAAGNEAASYLPAASNIRKTIGLKYGISQIIQTTRLNLWKLASIFSSLRISTTAAQTA